MKKQKGVALLLVLTMLSILVGIASNYVLTVSRETESIDITNNRTQARYSALSGIQYAQFAMQDNDEALRWSTNGKIFTIKLAGDKISVQILPESGRIDINRSNTKLLTLLFEYTGLDTKAAEHLANNVQHWRNPADLQIGDSVFDSDYQTSGKTPPPHRNFYAIEEIAQVSGMTLDIYSKIKPLITIFGSKRINALSASDETLKLLKISDNDITVLRSALTNYYNDNIPIPTEILQLSPFLIFREQDLYYRVLSYAVADNQTSEAVYAIIKNNQNRNGSFQTMQQELLSGKERQQLITKINTEKAQQQE